MLSEVNYRNQIEKYVHNTVTLEDCVVMKERCMKHVTKRSHHACAVINSNLEMALSKSIHRLR